MPDIMTEMNDPAMNGPDVDDLVDDYDDDEEPVDEIEAPAPRMTFAELGLDPTMLTAVSELGYDKATEIQERAIPKVLAGKDIVGCSQTGTGKTAAFVLPIAAAHERGQGHQGPRRHAHPRAGARRSRRSP